MTDLTTFLSEIKLNWIASTLSLVGVTLNCRKKIICWPIWILANTLAMIWFAANKEWSFFTLFTGYNLANFYGWWYWSKDASARNGNSGIDK